MNPAPITPPADAGPRPPSRPRRALRRLALVLVAGALLLGHRLWLPPLIEALLPPVAARLGYDLELEELARLDLSGAELVGLRLRARDERAPLRGLELDRAEASFERSLLTGDPAGLRRLRAGGVRLALGPGEQEPAAPGPPPRIPWPASLPEVELTGIEVALPGDEGGPRITGGRLLTSPGGGVSAAAVLNGRRLEARGRYAPAELRDLDLDLDGASLLRRSRLALDEEAVLVAELELSLEAARAHLDARLARGRVSWRLELADLDLDGLGARLAPDSAPDARVAGRLDLESEGELDLEDPLGGTARGRLAARDLELRGWAVPELAGELELADATLRVPELRVVQGPRNRLRLREGRLPLRGITAIEVLARARAELEVELEELEALLGPAGLVPPEGLVRHRLALSAHLEDERLSVREGRLESAAGDVELERGEVRLVELDGARRVAVDLDGRARVQDLAAFGELLGRRGWGGSLQGDLHAEGTLPAVRLEADLEAEGLVLEGLEVGRVEARARAAEGLARLELERLHARTPHGALTARGALERGPGGALRLDLAQLELERDGDGLALRDPTGLRLDGDRLVVERLELRGSAGHLEAEGSWSPGDARGHLEVHELHPGALLGGLDLELPTAEVVDLVLDLRLAGELLTFESEGRVVGLRHTSLGELQGLDLEWRLGHDGERLALADLTVSGGERLELSSSGSAPLRLVPALELTDGALELSLDTRADLAAVSTGLEGTARVRGSLGGTWAALGGELEVTAEGLRHEAARLAGLEAGTARGRLRLGDGIALEELALRVGERLDLAGSGRVEASLDARRWLAEPDAALEEATVQGRLDLTTLDLEEARPLLETLGLDELLREGLLAGHLEVEGPLLAPRPGGELTVRGGRVRPGGGLPSIEALETRILLGPDRIELGDCSGTLGAAPFRVEGGVALGPEGPVLDLALRGEDLLLFRDRSARVRADADLYLQGAPAALHVSGAVTLTRGRYAPDTRFLNLRPGPARPGARGFQLFSIREGPLADMTFDIEVDSAEPFEVHNLVLNGRVSPQLRLAGTGRVPVLEGRVYLDETALLLPAGRLTITGGTVLFSRDDPFVPSIEAVGEARMLGHDIRAGITGPYDNPEVELSSTPPLSQETLLVLLLTGQLQQGASEMNSRATATTIAVYIAQDTIGRWFAGDGPVDEDSIFERLELLYGEDVSQNGTETFDVAFRLTAREGLPKELKNRRHWFLTAQRDRYEDYNYGLRIVLRLR